MLVFSTWVRGTPKAVWASRRLPNISRTSGRRADRAIDDQASGFRIGVLIPHDSADFSAGSAWAAVLAVSFFSREMSSGSMNDGTDVGTSNA